MSVIATEADLMLNSIKHAMPYDEACSCLAEIIPVVHAQGQDHYVEALVVAMDAMTWFPLKLAPRDGTKVLLAVAPQVLHGLPGFICIGRWVEPADNLLEQMGKARRQRFAASGGWWSSSKSGRPFERPVLSWRPEPRFDFSAAGYPANEVETVNG